LNVRRILGIDPGLNRTGYGIVEIRGHALCWVDSGVLRIPAGDLPQRLHAILLGLQAVIERHAPGEVSVEKVFVNVNPKSTLLLGQARGAAICAAVGAGLPVHEYAALQVKQAVSGFGHADKVQVQRMVQRLLALQSAPATDAADALACAICHAHAGSRLKAGVAAVAVRRGGRRATRAAWEALVAGK
jgi:crossover junction endodeoxyribonuclease RuvC